MLEGRRAAADAQIGETRRRQQRLTQHHTGDGRRLAGDAGYARDDLAVTAQQAIGKQEAVGSLAEAGPGAAKDERPGAVHRLTARAHQTDVAG
jgi:hypothetical protein